MDKANQISGVEQAGPPEDGCSTGVARDELKRVMTGDNAVQPC